MIGKIRPQIFLAILVLGILAAFGALLTGSTLGNKRK